MSMSGVSSISLHLWYLLSTLHGHLASEHTQLKEKLEALRQDNIQLVREHNHAKQACEELRRLHEDDQREVADMRMLQQQVPMPLVILAIVKYVHLKINGSVHCLQLQIPCSHYNKTNVCMFLFLFFNLPITS